MNGGRSTEDRTPDILQIPGSVLSNLDIMYYVKHLPIPNFLGVFMRDEVIKGGCKGAKEQCGIMNLNTSNQRGIHWVAWFKNPDVGTIYFDSFGQDTPSELIRYLKTKKELSEDRAVIKRNIYIVQSPFASECGRLCLFVLKSLSNNIDFDQIIQVLKKRYDGNNN